MILKKKPKKENKNLKNNFYKYYFFSTFLSLIIFSTIFLNSEMWKYYKLKIIPRLEAYGVLNYVKLPEILILKVKGNFIKMDKLYLNINSNNLEKLESERKLVLKETEKNKAANNTTFKFQNYNAKINFKEKNYKVNIRLKGDRHIHWSDKNKISYRIKINNNGKIIGINEFSLQKPRVRNYIYEWIFHKLHAKNGSIDIKYNFINLYVNKKDMGLYVVEEFFTKSLLERNKRIYGPIFSINESFETNFNNRKFKVYDKKIWLHKSNIELTKKALSKLKSFLNEDVKVSEIFDADRLAEYIATNEILGTYHGLLLKSQRFYYNLESQKFEIIPFDGHYWNPILSSVSKIERDKLLVEREEKNLDLPGNVGFGILLRKKIYQDKEFAKKYFNALKKISSNKYLENFFKENEKEINKINALIYSDNFLNDFLHFYGPGIYYFDKNKIYERAEIIRKKLKTDKLKMFAYYDKGAIKIENLNIYNPYTYADKTICSNKNDLWSSKKVIKLDNQLILKNEITLINEKKLNTFTCSKVSIFNDSNNENFEISIDKINGESS